jgi:Sec-independent protein translocase protein TatA
MEILQGTGIAELMIVGIIVLVLFGKDLPNLVRSVGKSFAADQNDVAGVHGGIRNQSRSLFRKLSAGEVLLFLLLLIEI